MLKRLSAYFENPFFRSTLNVMGVQALFALLTLLVFAAAIWHQQRETGRIFNERRAAFDSGVQLAPE